MLADKEPIEAVGAVVHAGEVPRGSNFRLGGMVLDGSVTRTPGDLKVRFVLTDYNKSVPVEYEGILPDLFREGQGIIAQGALSTGASGEQVFVASEVLAKHDETYMPPEVADALKKAEEAKEAAGDS